MAYEKQEVKAGTIMDPVWGNYVQTQYEEAVKTMNGSQIVDKGSNADGDYIRYEDGTQICMQKKKLTGITTTPFVSGTIHRYVAPQQNQPKPFTELKHIEINFISSSNFWSTQGAVNNSSYYPTLYSIVSLTNGEAEFTMYAIGKWK